MSLVSNNRKNHPDLRPSLCPLRALSRMKHNSPRSNPASCATAQRRHAVYPTIGLARHDHHREIEPKLTIVKGGKLTE